MLHNATLGVCASDHTSKRVIVSCERCVPCTRCGQRKRGPQTARLFLIRYAHPRVQYLAMLPVHWVLEKEKSQAWDLCHPLIQKVTGLAHFVFCFWSDAVGCNVLLCAVRWLAQRSLSTTPFNEFVARNRLVASSRKASEASC